MPQLSQSPPHYCTVRVKVPVAVVLPDVPFHGRAVSVTAVFGVTDVTNAPFEVTVRVVVLGSA
jgi:hypothetical protein